MRYHIKNMKPNLVETLKNIINENNHLLEDSIEKIYLFGSFARKEETIYSDVDIALVYRDDINAKRGSSSEFKSILEKEIRFFNREIGWFSTNEHNIKKSTGIFNTNTRIREEGVPIWIRTVT